MNRFDLKRFLLKFEPARLSMEFYEREVDDGDFKIIKKEIVDRTYLCCLNNWPFKITYYIVKALLFIKDVYYRILVFLFKKQIPNGGLISLKVVIMLFQKITSKTSEKIGTVLKQISLSVKEIKNELQKKGR